MKKKIFFRCSCFVQSNIYLEQLRTHVHYTTDEQFREQYANVNDEMLDLVHKEINRRKTLDIDAQKRKEQISRDYKPLHSELYQFQVEFLSQDFKQLCSEPKLASEYLKKHGSNRMVSFVFF